jgi:hypothetical protein
MRRLVIVLLGSLLGLGLFCGPLAGAACADTATGAQKVAVFEDATVGSGEVWDVVVVVGGDLLVQGSVENRVVVVGGDVTVADGGRIGTDAEPADTVLVSVFGDVVVQPGGALLGETVDVAGWGGGPVAAAGGSLVRTWEVGSILSWVWSTVFLAVVAVLAAAVAPRQVAATRDRARHHFFSSMGWGALALLIVVPIATVFLITIIVGILVAVPGLLIGLPLLTVFAFTAVGSLVGGFLLRSRQADRGPLMLAAVVGVIVMNLARWIPVAGVVILVLLWFVGVGATLSALWLWAREGRRRRRDQERMSALGQSGTGSWSAPGTSGTSQERA